MDETDIHHVLRNERRRQVIEYLSKENGNASLRKLSESIASNETGESPPPTDKKKSVYISLHQTHLPTLETHGIVEYDQSSKEVELCEGVEEINTFIGRSERSKASDWYPIGTTLALLTIIAASVGMPIFSAVDVLVWATLFLVLLGSFMLVDRFDIIRNRNHDL